MFQCVERLAYIELGTSIDYVICKGTYKYDTILDDVNKLVVIPITRNLPRYENLYIHNILHTISKFFFFVLSFDSQEHLVALLSLFVLLFNMNLNS